jgi:hypothetical protein
MCLRAKTVASFIAVAAVLTGAQAAHAASNTLLPNLVQKVPFKVGVQSADPVNPGRQELIFGSSVENLGPGPLIIDGRKSNRSVDSAMTVSQAVMRANGSVRAGAARGIGQIYFDHPHNHWHLRAFDRYELRDATTGALVAPDAKRGFCLGDRYKAKDAGAGQAKVARAAWPGHCHRGDTKLARIREGISVGWGDDYVPQLEGQFIDITDVPNGTYVLSHHANTSGAIRETRLDDNASSVRLTIARLAPGAAPMVAVVGECFLAANCDPAQRPRSESAPTVSRQGRTLRCSQGTWSGAPTGFWTQWFRGDTPVPGAQAASYRLRPGGSAAQLTCRVTAANGFASNTAMSGPAPARR